MGERMRADCLRLGLGCMLGWMGIGGCATLAPTGPDGALVASATPYERSIPLPAGFELVDQGSEDFHTGPLRYLRHRYVGRADKYAVRKFYRRQMPLVRWTPVSDSQVDGRYTMRFERAQEACTITIEDHPALRAGSVRIEVIVAPQPPADAPAAQTPGS